MEVRKAIRDAARLAMRNKAHVELSDSCGCYYCGKIFKPADIKEWTDDGWTALCPNCSVDSVLCSAHRVPITSEYLHEVNRYWF